MISALSRRGFSWFTAPAAQYARRLVRKIESPPCPAGKVYALFVIFRFMGRDYEAAVICSGFAGISLGATPTAMANMTAVAKKYGQAHRAFIIVPLVSGFFVDIANAMVISRLLVWFG